MNQKASRGNGLSLVVYGLMHLAVLTSAFYALKPHAAELPNGPRMAELRQHVRQVGSRPHSLGTAEHDRVRDYIISMLERRGLKPLVERSTVTWDAGDLVRAADVQNIVVRLPGTDPKAKAVLVASHYDSASQSPGAADAGASVAAMLELARLKTAGPLMKAPIVLLFSDGEEWGLLGARAFLEHHAPAGEIAAIINLDARGSAGRPFVFEMNGSTSRLSAVLNRCATPALAASYSSLAYRFMPNRTDFTLFREAGLSGFNVAFFDDPSTYHNSADTAARLNQATLVEQANTLYRLSGCLADAVSGSLESGPAAVYASVPGGRVLSYPESYPFPIAIFLLAVTVWLCAARRTSGPGLLRAATAAAAMLLTIVATAALAWCINLGALSGINPKLMRWQAHDELLAGAVIVAATSAFWGVCLLSRRFGRKELLSGMVIVLALLNAGVSFWLPALSFPTLIAILSGILAMAMIRAVESSRDAYAYALAFAPAIFVWAQLGILLATALGTGAQAPILLVCALVSIWIFLGPSQPAFLVRRIAPAFVAIAALFLVFARLTAHFDDRRPRPDTLLLAADLSAGEALWSTFDPAVDEWNGRYLRQPEKRNLGEFFGVARVDMLASPAQLPKLAGPDAQVVAAIGNGVRLLLKPEPGTAAMRCDIYSDAPIAAIAIQGRPVAVPSGRQKGGSQAVFTLAYLNPPAEGAVLELRLAEAAPFGVALMDMLYGFPGGGGMDPVHRPPQFVAEPDYLTDCTLLRRVFRFDAAGKSIESEVPDLVSKRR